MSHPFGDAITQFLHRKHGLSISKLATGIDQPRSVVGLMCQGQRLTGPQARDRVVAIIRWLNEQEALETLEEANLLLRAAGMADLDSSRMDEGRLVQQLRKQAPAAPISPAAPSHRAAPAALRPRLPRPLSSFVGRRHELAEVSELLQLPTTRLLTLIGAGGCGKTRLALQVATDMAEAHPDGVWWVELAALTDPALVPQTIAAALGVQEHAGHPVKETLLAHLRERDLLLVLDNCEHLVDACASIVEDIFQTCPAIKILATSREELHILGETIWLVPSLSFPRSQVRTGSTLDLDLVEESEAAQLFIERVKAKLPSFTLTRQNAPAILQICQRLDGIPLALELAAARIPMLTVEQLAARLDNRFQVLTSGSRTALPRHQTLHALITWSYDLLTAEEKVLLNRLSIFAGSWTLEAAEAICSGTIVGADRVMEIMQELIQKSMVVVETQDDVMRYYLLETIREYAAEKLYESGEAEALATRYSDWFLALVERAYAEITGQDQVAWFSRMSRERDNVQAALVWASKQGKIEAVARFVVALYRFWLSWAWLSEARRWLELVLLHTGELPKDVYARVLSAAGMIAQVQGDYENAYSRYRMSLELTREIGKPAMIATALANLGDLAYGRSDYQTARGLYEESLELRRQIGEPAAIATALAALGIVAYGQGDYDEACRHFEESLAIRREIGNRQGSAQILLFLGGISLERGDFAEARALIEENLVIRRLLGDERGIIQALIVLGRIALVDGDVDTAEALEEEAIERCRGDIDKWLIAAAMNNLGRVARAQGHYELAARRHAESLRLRRDLGARRDVAECLTDFGALAAAQADWMRAAQFLGAAESLRQAIGTRLPPVDQAEFEDLRTQVQSRLDYSSWSNAYAAGKAMSPEEAIAFALEPVEMTTTIED